MKLIEALQYNTFIDRSKAVILLWIISVISVLWLLCYRTRVYMIALWSAAGKGLTSLLTFVMSNYDVVTFPCGNPGQMWYLIASIPDLCPLSYFEKHAAEISRGKDVNFLSYTPSP